MTETYELFAIKYAHHDRDATANFIDDCLRNCVRQGIPFRWLAAGNLA